jgi:hypothetical protein
MIPPRALEIHKEIEEYIDPDNLELRKPRWNASTFVPRSQQAQKEPFSRKLTKVSYTFTTSLTPTNRFEWD